MRANKLIIKYLQTPVGELIGYAGGLQAKKSLLKLENSGQRPEQLDLFE